MHVFLALIPCLVVVNAAGVLLAIIFFTATHRRVGKLADAVIKSESSRDAEASELTNALNELKRRLAELEKLEAPSGAEIHPDQGLSNSVRSMAFKLRRAGQAPDEIAQKLRMSRGEVELLIKAQRMIMRPYENAEGAAAGAVEKG